MEKGDEDGNIDLGFQKENVAILKTTNERRCRPAQAATAGIAHFARW